MHTSKLIFLIKTPKAQLNKYLFIDNTTAKCFNAYCLHTL